MPGGILAADIKAFGVEHPCELLGVFLVNEQYFKGIIQTNLTSKIRLKHFWFYASNLDPRQETARLISQTVCDAGSICLC